MKRLIVAFALLSLMPWANSAKTVKRAETIQCGNLIFAGTNTSRCFSSQFLREVQKKTTVATERRFKAVKLASDEVYQLPFVVMTGENSFTLAPKERKNLKTYLEKGGFMLVSAGCSNKDFDDSFRQEVTRVFGKDALKPIPMDHILFKTVNQIKEIKLSHAAKDNNLYGLTIKDKIVLVYSPHGLNDTAHTEGCCCCGGNEIVNSMQINVNVLVYALLY